MMLKIRTKDNRVVEVIPDDLQVSGLFAILQDSITDPEEEIPLYNVDYNVFMDVIEYTRHYQIDPMKTIEKPLKDDTINVQKWYVDYISRQHQDGLYMLLEASTYLDIEPLQELICAKIASLIKGTECDELKKILDLDYET